MHSRQLNIETNVTQNLCNLKRTGNPSILQATENVLVNNVKLCEQIDSMKRSNIHNDLENIEERLNEMLITVVPTNDGELSSLIPNEQISTTEYFTPKIFNEQDNHRIHQQIDNTDDNDDLDPMTNEINSSTHPFYDVLSKCSYENEVMKYLLELEARFMSDNAALRSSKRIRQSTNHFQSISSLNTNNSMVFITSKVRCKLIDWIISVHDYHRLNAAILCRTIHLIDRILLFNDQMSKLDLQLHAVNCFTIACKLESRRVPDINCLLALFDARHRVTSIVLNHGEKQLLTQLNFELEYPLAIHFLCYYLRFLPFHFIIYSLSKYMIECVLCDENLCEQMSGSMLAASALLLALKLTRQFNNLQIEKRFYKCQPYKHDELDKYSEQIFKLMQNVPRSIFHSNVREKYKRSEFDRVATFQYTHDLVVPVT